MITSIGCGRIDVSVRVGRRWGNLVFFGFTVGARLGLVRNERKFDPKRMWPCCLLILFSCQFCSNLMLVGSYDAQC